MELNSIEQQLSYLGVTDNVIDALKAYAIKGCDDDDSPKEMERIKINYLRNLLNSIANGGNE